MEVRQSNKGRSEKRLRKQYLIARCTKEEKDIALTMAKLNEMSLGDFVRQRTINASPLNKYKKIQAHAEAILLLKAEVNKIGSNINQTVKVINTTKTISISQVEDLIHHLAKCYEEISKLSQK